MDRLMWGAVLLTGLTDSKRRLRWGPVLLPGDMDSGLIKLRDRGGLGKPG